MNPSDPDAPMKPVRSKPADASADLSQPMKPMRPARPASGPASAIPPGLLQSTIPADFEEKFAKFKKLSDQGTVLGLKDINGVMARQDIDVFMVNEPKTFNLFLLAIHKLQEQPESDPMSWFNIAAIHGYPKRPWNNVEGKILGVGGETQEERDANESGYCNHALTTFPVWHRVYVAMLEQSIFVTMVEIAKTYNDPYKNEYIAAALKFRLPFWDYYRPRGGKTSFPGIIDPQEGNTSAPYDFCLPKIFTEEVICARVAPDNQLVELDRNPLHHFNFNDKVGNLTSREWDYLSVQVEGQVNPILSREYTHRHPTGYGNQRKWNNPDRMNAILNELRMDSNRYMLNMVGQDYYGMYDSFSNMASLHRDETLEPAKPQPNDPNDDNLEEGDSHYNAAHTAWENSGSLEDFHNLYHLLVGGLDPGAHMSRVPIAAFDPAFWFLHGNVERIFTVWQAAHADPAENETSWFTQKKDATSSMLPFKKADGSFWTPDELRLSQDLGYTYADCQKSSPQAVRLDFDALYRWSVPRQSTESWLPCPPDRQPLDLSHCDFFSTKPQTPQDPIIRDVETVKHAGKIDEIWEWYIDVKVSRLALNGAFSILFYINDEKNQNFDDKKDIMGPTLAGVTHVFAAPIEVCPHCKRQFEEGTLVTSTVPITSQLMDYISVGQLKSLTPKHVKKFLIQHLRWRIVTANHDRIDPRSLSNKKQLRLGISAVQNHGDVINNQSPPEVYRFPNIVKKVIKKADKGAAKDLQAQMAQGIQKQAAE